MKMLIYLGGVVLLVAGIILLCFYGSIPLGLPLLVLGGSLIMMSERKKEKNSNIPHERSDESKIINSPPSKAG